MKKISFILFLFCPAFLLSCRGGTDLIPGPSKVTPYYIQAYTKADRIGPSSSAPGEPVWISFRGKTYTNSSGKDGEVFGELSQRYGDTHFNRIASQDPPASSLLNEFTEIDIYSSQDFNGIPAGSSLGSVTELLATTFKPYIESGYEDEFDWVRDRPESYKNYPVGREDGRTLHPVYGTVAGIDPAELVLVDPFGVCFQFLEEPEIKHHTLYIRFKDKERILNCMVEYDFK